MVGPYGDCIQWTYNKPVFLIAEIDGTRVVGPEQTEFITKVAPSLEAVFNLGSTHPAAILFDASEHYNVRLCGRIST